MKTVGIIGGLGPETTSEFYLDIVFSCYKKSKEARPGIIIRKQNKKALIAVLLVNLFSYPLFFLFAMRFYGGSSPTYLTFLSEIIIIIIEALLLIYALPNITKKRLIILSIIMNATSALLGSGIMVFINMLK